jgi:hypothetical protein
MLFWKDLPLTGFMVISFDFMSVTLFMVAFFLIEILQFPGFGRHFPKHLFSDSPLR